MGKSTLPYAMQTEGENAMNPDVKLAAETLVKSDIILLLLAAPTRVRSATNALPGITRLEKLVFLAEQETELPKLIPEGGFSFQAYNYGPYSREIYQAVELLEEAGLLTEERVSVSNALDEMEEISIVLDEQEGVERRFHLTEDGKTVARFLLAQHQKVSDLLTGIKDRYAAMPLRQLIRYVYTRYPKYAEQSLIRDQVL